MASTAAASPSPSPPLSLSSSDGNPDRSPAVVNSDRSPSGASPGADGVPRLALLPASAAAAAAPPSAASSRRVPPPCWSVEETLALIDSYQEKWYALRRGNLRATHWQEVADAVSRRCQRLPASSSSPAAPKTPVQCRHKMEKLRKRYRSERQRALRVNPNAPPISSWVFFRKMDAMEQGTAPGAPVSARASPLTTRASAPSTSQSSSESSSPSEDEEGEEEDDDGGGGNGYHNARSINGMMSNGRGHGGGPMGVQRFLIPKNIRSKTSVSHGEESLRNPGTRRLSSSHQNRFFGGYPRTMPPSELAETRRRDRKRKEMDGGSAMGEVVAAVRTLADGFLRMEQMQMDMVRETHKLRMEMELKRTEMMLDSQRRIVDSFLKDFVGSERAKVSPES